MLISKRTSTALDVLRVAAALTVFLHHCNFLGLDDGWLNWVRRDVGHSAVVIFFVLSGYVIAATLRPGETLWNYAARRAARVYSVAIPAIVLTVAIDMTMTSWHMPPPHSAYELDKLWVYVPLAFTFASSLWAWGLPVFSNDPYWSLCYEVWYYVAFGAAALLTGWQRWIATALVLAIMGPKLLLLFPIWLGGVGVVWLQRRYPLSCSTSRLIVAGSIALFLLIKAFNVEDVVNAMVPTAGLQYSQWFLGDYLVAVLMIALVYALGTASIPLGEMRPVVWLAKVSFSIYLTHFPLLLLFQAALPGQRLMTILLALSCSIAFGLVFEPQKDRLRRVLLHHTA